MSRYTDNQIAGKKLMLLGGVRAACEIIKEAHKYGVLVYETDYLEDSPAKKYADKAFMVSCTDVDAVVTLCREEGVDGVFTGYTDSLLPFAEQICRKLNFPFWGNSENIAMSIDKKLFKTACEKSGVPVVPWKLVNPSNYKDELQDIQLPVVFKPVDNSGGRGVYKCYKQEDLMSLCEQSFSFSKSKEVIVERLMNAHSEFSAYYIMNHGDIYLTGMGDKYVVEVVKDIAPVSSSMVMPSIHLEQWIKDVNPVMMKFFKDNQMNNGYVFIQGFYENHQFYIHEMGYRLNGGFTFKFVEHFCGYNQVHQLVKFSLTGEMDKEEVSKSDPFLGGNKGMALELSLKQGVIGSIEGVEEVSNHPGVMEFYQLKEVGAVLSSNGTTAQTFADIYVTAESEQELQELVKYIEDTIKVFDISGKNMLQPMLDPYSIKFS